MSNPPESILLLQYSSLSFFLLLLVSKTCYCWIHFFDESENEKGERIDAGQPGKCGKIESLNKNKRKRGSVWVYVCGCLSS